MMDTIKAFFEAAPAIAWSIVSLLVALVFVAYQWEKVKWWWLNTWMSFPIFGRIATLSKDLNKDSADNSWFKAEKSLCRDYKSFIRIQDEDDFNEKITYLTKAGDTGRTPTPLGIWLLTIALVFAEAMGFSYVLAGWTIPGASESTQQYGALGIAFIISVILVAFTHWAGHELYISSKLKHARREWAEDGRKNKFTTGVIPLARSQSSDDEQPGYTQLANRVGTHASYKLTMATALIVLIVAAGATYVRGQVLEKSLHQQVVGSQNQGEINASLNGDGLDISAKNAAKPALPDSDVAQNQATKNKAAEDEANIDRHGGWGTFIILAFIFIFLQILGVLFGYKWGFAGPNSKAAFTAIGSGRYTSYSDVRDHYREIADAAQAKLETLQQKLMQRNADIGTEGMHTKNTFWKFMEMTRLEESGDRANQRQHTAQKDAVRKVESSAPAAQEAVSAPLSVDAVVQKINAMGEDKAGKLTYLATLPVALRTEVIAKLKAHHEASQRVQLEAEAGNFL